ncbi:PHP domain-containing protein [Thermodesulfobacteriota bacterium]
MKIDLHIHSSCSDGQMTVDEIFKEASERNIEIISIADHDSIDCQENAGFIAPDYSIKYIYGLELSIIFSHPDYINSKPISLDFLAYDYDIKNKALIGRLEKLRMYRKKRAEQILDKINEELVIEGKDEFTSSDLESIESSVDGAFGRPHIADYMVKKGVVASRQEAFDRYLVKCNVPKMPLSLAEASDLVKGAGGKLFLAHPNHPRGTSLIKLTTDLKEQKEIISKTILPYIDGIECWHAAHDSETVKAYEQYSKKYNLLMAGGSDCHQQPVIMGSVDVPAFVAKQFKFS